MARAFPVAPFPVPPFPVPPCPHTVKRECRVGACPPHRVPATDKASRPRARGLPTDRARRVVPPRDPASAGRAQQSRTAARCGRLHPTFWGVRRLSTTAGACVASLPQQGRASPLYHSRG
eukprot:gene13866-biopygen23078